MKKLPKQSKYAVSIKILKDHNEKLLGLLNKSIGSQGAPVFSEYGVGRSGVGIGARVEMPKKILSKKQKDALKKGRQILKESKKK